MHICEIFYQMKIIPIKWVRSFDHFTFEWKYNFTNLVKIHNKLNSLSFMINFLVTFIFQFPFY